ncbi:MAG: hypothetical protein IJY93_03905 [Clostridia bacterium]|nr:hypothetical protein [Clostridia bacterium]
MNEYFVLSDSSAKLGIGLCAHAVNKVINTLLYKGSCLYLPSPSAVGQVILTIDKKDATDSETEWFLRTLAGYLCVDILDSDGNRLFEDSEDNDISFIDTLPPPDDEYPPLHLFFTIDGVDGRDCVPLIKKFFTDNDFEITPEPDGFSVFLASNSYLDIFYASGEARISGDIDCSFSGAGVYAEAVEIAELFAGFIGESVSFVEDPRVTYTSDKDFDKLRRAFYQPLRQQLTFAINDDRDGLQAYFGWGTDAFEPKPIRGSLVTPLGRYDIERLLGEIERYGFSYVCDHRFLIRNTPKDDSDYYIKEAFNIICNSTVGAKDENFSVQEQVAILQCIEDLEMALKLDSKALFPREVYKRLCAAIKREPLHCDTVRDYELHFDPGYLRDEIYYGFGHYLRRFSLPGYFTRNEISHGEDVFFSGDTKNGFRLECAISYGYNGDGTESPLGKNWAISDESAIEPFDIGGTSVVRFIDGGFSEGQYRAEAEVYIKDEVYRFAMVSDSHDDVENFRETLRGCISVEDWYDEYIREESPDPHAPGATFCTNGITPECTAFSKTFPIYREHLMMPTSLFKNGGGNFTGILPITGDEHFELYNRIIDEIFKNPPDDDEGE